MKFEIFQDEVTKIANKSTQGIKQMLNKTLNYLLARRSETLLCFSGQVATSSVYLNGPGGESGDGFPLPKGARIYRIDCWDGSDLLTGTGNIVASQGDRLSVYAKHNAGNFNVKLRKNGSDTALAAAGAATETSLLVTLQLQMV